jgi:hypothetical protein
MKSHPEELVALLIVSWAAMTMIAAALIVAIWMGASPKEGK